MLVFAVLPDGRRYSFSGQWIEIANLFQLFVMPPDSFVQRLVNYSTSCCLIRVWISISTDGRRYDVPLIAPAVG
jgi:hypothetical protein